jgi:hypothetical protein
MLNGGVVALASGRLPENNVPGGMMKSVFCVKHGLAALNR